MQRESNWSVSGDQRVALRTRRPPPASCATNAAAELHISPCAADRALSVYCACYTFSSSSRVLTNAIITLEWEPSPRSSFAMSVLRGDVCLLLTRAPLFTACTPSQRQPASAAI